MGDFLYVGGPSKYVGMTKIAKIDITTPNNPSIILLADKIPGQFVDF